MRRRRLRPTHPGEMLRLDFLPDYKLTAEELALSLRLPLDVVRSLLAETRGVDAEMALRLARYFGNSPEFWMALQRDVDFFDALESGEADIGAILPLDPARSAYAQDREPLPDDLVLELREQIADLENATRWVIANSVFDDDPLEDDSIATAFYEIGSDCWAVGIEHGTSFKREWAARAVAAGLCDGVRVLEVTPDRLARVARVKANETSARKRYLRRSRQGLKVWRPEEFLRTEGDMAAYLEIAAEEGGPELLSAAVGDVLLAMRECCRAELREVD